MGAVSVFHGGPSGVASAPNWVKEGDAANQWFGRSVATVADLNSDGYGDLLVADSGGISTRPGLVQVYTGSATGLRSEPTQRLESPQLRTTFGSILGSGEFTGDGVSDVIVSASLARVRSWGSAGSVFFYRSVGGQLELEQGATRSGAVTYALYGWLMTR